MRSSVILPLFFITATNADFAFNSNTEFSYPLYFNFKIGNDNSDVKVQVDTNRPYTLVLHEECFHCPMYFKDNYRYSEKKTGGSFVENFTSPSDGIREGAFYSDKLKFSTLSLDVKLAVVSNGYPSIDYYPGVLGLKPSTDDEKSVVKRLMNELSEQQIVIQDGRHYVLKDFRRVRDDNLASISFGKYEGDACGNFTFTKTLDNSSWRIRADVTVDSKLRPNQTIAFNVGGETLFPKDLFRDRIDNKTFAKQSELPTISFKIDDQVYQITPEDYATFVDDLVKYKGDVRHIPDGSDADFVFGTDLLQHHCLALTANKDFTELRIGFAPNYGRKPLARDLGVLDKGATAYSLSVIMAGVFMALLR
uniref:Peptidase A1 domain-containing protein n=1 Tax=Bursaphelenchus xylophilus TaxID=6326 RepID=A0A1I7RTH5_BURXY